MLYPKMVDGHTRQDEERERERATQPLLVLSTRPLLLSVFVCVCVCMHTHTLRKEIYEFWSPEKHVKLQEKEEGEG